jgi:uncharacterized protein (TIGR02444 family)
VDLWSFSERLYSQPGIEALCLELQDSYDANVLILLWCAWLEVQARSLSHDQLRLATKLVASACAPTVVPLRALRRALKTSSVLPDDVARQVRKSILDAELTVERYVLNQLQVLPGDDTAARCGGTDLSPLALYWKRLEGFPADTSLSVLRSAAASVWHSRH